MWATGTEVGTKWVEQGEMWGNNSPQGTDLQVVHKERL